jgi:hypothetical protein
VRKAFGPCAAHFLWEDQKTDGLWIKTVKGASEEIRKVVLEEIRKVALEEEATTNDAPIYSNFTLEDTPVEHIYRENLQRLREVRKNCNPDDLCR